MNLLDKQLTEIMLAGEKKSACKRSQLQYWSPMQKNVARTYSYWRQKFRMSQMRSFPWKHLDQLRVNTDITDYDHQNRDFVFIHQQLKQCCNKWKVCKKQCYAMHKRFLSERAQLMASKMKTNEERAIKAIIRAEESCCIYYNLRTM